MPTGQSPILQYQRKIQMASRRQLLVASSLVGLDDRPPPVSLIGLDYTWDWTDIQNPIEGIQLKSS
jgi:hypothetical protein